MVNGKDDILTLIMEILNGNDIQPSDIPDIDLYMDQVTTFIDNKLGHLKRDEDDKLLTKTMINNYTKSKILLPSKNKKYNDQHLILLVLIYYLKQILSINDIHSLFVPLFKNINASKEQTTILSDIYTLFLEIKKDDFKNFADETSTKLNMIKEKTQSINTNDSEFVEMFLTVLMLVSQAYAQKRLAEKIIDEYFTATKKQ